MTNKGLQTQETMPRSVFFAVFVLVFFGFLAIANSFGFVPYYIDGSAPLSASAATALKDSHDLALAQLPQLGTEDGSADAALAAAAKAAAHATQAVQKPIYPVRITIESVEINLPVQNPSTTNIDALDALLASGPARYASSATLGKAGNMVIFAHSSHLPIVHNKMFQAFNNVPNAKPGDAVVLLGSDGNKYVYEVDSVVQASTDDGTSIPLETTGTKLTLVTCDTLTGKTARFVLTATYAGRN